MRIVLDHQLVRALFKEPAPLLDHPEIANPKNEIVFGWPSFLEYLNLDLLLPTIDENHPLFQASIATLHTDQEHEALLYIYDNLFALNLTQVKTHPQMNAPFLLHALKIQREKHASLPILEPTLTQYEKRLSSQPADAMHDLVLYLAWDRMCITMGRIFDYQSNNPAFHRGLSVFKQCLLESFQHISEQKKTSPSLYRMLEALFFYEMREEKIPKHTEDQWEIFTQTFPVLKGQDELVDFLYIDEQEDLSAAYFAADAADKVDTRLLFARFMTEKIKNEIPDWKFLYTPRTVISLKDC
jgi:hypothetical protein